MSSNNQENASESNEENEESDDESNDVNEITAGLQNVSFEEEEENCKCSKPICNSCQKPVKKPRGLPLNVLRQKLEDTDEIYDHESTHPLRLPETITEDFLKNYYDEIVNELRSPIKYKMSYRIKLGHVLNELYKFKYNPPSDFSYTNGTLKIFFQYLVSQKWIIKNPNPAQLKLKRLYMPPVSSEFYLEVTLESYKYSIKYPTLHKNTGFSFGQFQMNFSKIKTLIETKIQESSRRNTVE